MRKSALICALSAFLVGMALVVLPASASAGGSSETCTSGECKFMPATYVSGTTVTTEEGSHSESSSESSSFTVKKAKSAVKTYERTYHRRVVVREKKNGIKGSRGCMDPEKQGLIKAGELFWNTDNGVPFLDVWQAGWEICHYREVTSGGKKYLEGTKRNCGNKHIKISLHFKIETTVKVVPSLEVKSLKWFWKKVWTKSRHSAKSTSGSTSGTSTTTEGHYTCPAGWTLTSNNTCRCCPPPQCKPQEEEPPCGSCTPPPPPHECTYGSVWNGHECVKDGNTTPPPPTEAPGKDPPPSGGEGDPGSNKCYSEETGQPVSPRSDGTCPAGSFGA